MQERCNFIFRRWMISRNKREKTFRSGLSYAVIKEKRFRLNFFSERSRTVVVFKAHKTHSILKKGLGGGGSESEEGGLPEAGEEDTGDEKN